MRKNVPDVVLLDIMMSYILDGLDVSREMADRSDPQECPSDHGHFSDRGQGQRDVSHR